MQHKILVLILASFTAGCGSSAPMPATPLTPSFADFEAVNDAIESTRLLLSLGDTDLPSGTVNYDGNLAGDIYVEGVEQGSFRLIGDVNLSVDFVNEHVTGEVDQIFLTNNDIEPTQLEGMLNVDQRIGFGNALFVEAGGTLTADPTTLPFGGTSDVTIEFFGSYYDDQGQSVIRGGWNEIVVNGDFEFAGSGPFAVWQVEQ